MKDKKTLITIIVLLVIFLPLAITGTYKHFSIENKKSINSGDNPNKEFILNNKVYFYVDNKLVSTYECDNCELANTIIDDVKYHTNYYKDGSKEISGTINNYFSIFKKENSYILYNFVSKGIIDEYRDIKNYSVESLSSFLINRKSSGWGVIFFEIGKSAIPSDYDYIALPAHLINKKLDSSKFIAMKNNMWFVLDSSGSAISSAVKSEIVDFNDKYYITYDNGYHIYDYNNVEYLSTLPKSNVYGVGKYLFIVNNNQLFIYEDANLSMIKFITLPDYKSLYFSQESDGIDVIIDKNVSQKLELT